jgi:dTDP-glucose 4,6-dehydratase
VDDLIEGIYQLLLSDEHQPVNIGNPIETTILEFAESINRITGNQAGIIYRQDARGEGDPQQRRPDISRAKELLGWEPKINLEQGLAKTIPYFQEKMGLA